MIDQWDSSLSILPVARVMMAQWDSSLSVLPIARVMIANWDSPLSVLPVAQVMIAQWDCSLSVLHVARVMIAQWESSLSVLPVAQVQFPTAAEYFKESDHMCCLVQGSGSAKGRSGAPLEKAFSLMSITRCLRISLVYGKTKTKQTLCTE